MLSRNWAMIVIALLILAFAFFLGRFLYQQNAVFADVFTGMVLILTGFVAFSAYRQARINDSLILSEKKRDDFVNSEIFQHVRMLIEHNDIELQTVVAILNITDPYESGLLPTKYQELHEEYDQYLNFLEGVAILSERKNISQESLQSLWLYYFRRLKDVQIPISKDGQLSFSEMRECTKEIYGGSIPDSVENAWRKKSKQKPPEEVADPVDKGRFIHPIGTPIWYYINHSPYAFRSLIIVIQKLYLNENLEENTRGIGGIWSKLRLWTEFCARFTVWVSAITFAILTVLGVLPILPEPTSMSLLIWLYLFIIAALIQWLFDIRRLFPPKKQQGN